MKIIHVVAYYPPHMGGMEQRVKELASLQAAKGLDVFVLTSNVGSPTGNYLQEMVKVRYLRCFEFAHTPITPSLYWHLMRARNIQLIHLHIAQAFFPETVALVSKLRGIPYVAHVRCLIIPSGVFGKLLPFYNKHILGRVLRGARKVIALTPDYKEIINTQFKVPLNRIEVIPNATTFSVIDQPRKLPHQPLRLLAVGRISVQKNYPFMLEVAEVLKKNIGLDFKLKIVGPGDRTDLETIVQKRGIADRVKFLGEIVGKALEDVYTESDILVHSSLIEGFSTVFLEAMAKGLPIVASDVVGTRSVIKNESNGLLTSLSVDVMSKAILRLVNEPDLYRDISENNIKEISKYSWNEILRLIFTIYQECQ